MENNNQVAEELQQEVKVETPNLGGALWGDEQLPPVQVISDPIVATIAQENLAEEPKTTNEIDYTSFLKETFGYETVESAKEEIESLKKIKETQSKYDFKNDDAKNLYEAFADGNEDAVYDYLSKKKQIDKLVKAEINEDNALDVLKISLQSKEKELSEEDIEFLLKDKYSVPRKPNQRSDELDSEYDERLEDWEVKAKEINRRKIIDAKLAKKDIEQLISNIELPKIERNAAQQNIDPKVLEQQEKVLNEFKQELEQTYKSYQGVSVKAKCEDAEFLLQFSPKDDEKVELKNKMNDFDMDGYFTPRWVKEDGKVNTSKMIDDIYWLENKDAIIQKIANESAAQMSLFIRQKNSNLNLKGTAQQQVFNPQGTKTEMEALQDSIWK